MLDENCDGLAEPFPTVASGVEQQVGREGLAADADDPAGHAAVPQGLEGQDPLQGLKCPFRSKTLKAGKVKKAASTIISALSKSQRRFRAGQTLEIWVSAPSFNTKVARLVLKKGKIPTTEPYCVKAGETKVQKTCS